MKRRTFLQQLSNGYMPEPNSGCWLWLKGLTKKGYAYMKTHDGKTRSAHRTSYQLFKGEIPKDLVINHLCRTRSCVNADHMEAVTNLVNIQRGNTGINFRSRTACPRGHAYDEKNSQGARGCKTCHNKSTREYYARIRNSLKDKEKAQIAPSPLP